MLQAVGSRRRRPGEDDEVASSASHITNGIIGNFSINSTGDIDLTPITIYKQVGKNLVPRQDAHPGGQPGRRPVTKER